MAETNVTTAQTGSGIAERLQEALRQGDIVLALCVVSILLVLLLPIPPWLIDILLTTSMAFAILILLVSLFIKKPLDFSTYPTVLLMATLLRLALNLATTRLILSHGSEGSEAAGRVIQAFGTLVMSGNFLIGVIVFAILVIVNFVVITKGSGRIAEVAARFSLDGMPGKQMAIDADLSAGLIDEKGARERRAKLEGESAFFGAMDGASKFVRGDAVAGLLVVFINIIGGIVIGTFQHGMTITQAAQNYTLLTVGDGLVTQIPALIVSISAGMLVSKAGVQGPAEEALLGQLGGYPKALWMASALLTTMSVMPGLPMLPFLLLGSMTGGAAYFVSHTKTKEEEKKAEAAAAPAPPPAEEPISTALHIDVLRLELGYGLLPMINSEKGPKLTDQIKALRRQIAADMGFVMPSVRIQDNIQLQSNSYVIRVKEIVAGRGDLQPHQLLVMDPRGEPIQLPGTPTKEPTFGLPAMWVDEPHREEATFKGYTVVDPPTVITTHLTEVIKDNMAEMLSYSETQKLLDEAGKTHQKLIAEMVPAQISVGGIQRVLQNLLGERVSIRDLTTILEAIAEAVTHTRNLTAITEHVRSRLARQLCDTNTGGDGVIALVTLSPEWEQAFAESIVGQGDDRQLSMAPSRLQDFIAKVRQTFEKFAMMGENPVLLTSPLIRPFVRSIVERFRPVTTVMSQNEIYPKARIKTVASI